MSVKKEEVLFEEPHRIVVKSFAEFLIILNHLRVPGPDRPGRTSASQPIPICQA